MNEDFLLKKKKKRVVNGILEWGIGNFENIRKKSLCLLASLSFSSAFHGIWGEGGGGSIFYMLGCVRSCSANRLKHSNSSNAFFRG